MLKKIALPLGLLFTLSSSVLASDKLPFQAVETIQKVEYELKDYRMAEMDRLGQIALEEREHNQREFEESERKRIEEEKEVERIQEQEDKKVHWKFEVSFYDADWQCTQNGDGQTASGEYAVEGVTIALPSDIPFGTQVYIEGLGWRTNQDTGGFIQYTTDDEGNTVMRVDVYVESHDRALELGRYYANGYIKY